MEIPSAGGDHVQNGIVLALGSNGLESFELGGFHAEVHEKKTIPGQTLGTAEPESGKIDTKDSPAKASANSTMKKKKKVPPKMAGKRYTLRSCMDGVRVLRSSQNKTPVEPTTTTSNPVKGRRKKRSKVKKTSKDEYLRIRQRVRYLLSRISYEQNLIDAYSAEGWKGQNLEKLRPEKELERAKSEILRRKLEIRNIFHRLDSLLAEGRLLKSLFDSEGQISSEDIFCARCGSKELSAHNDIILCDGVCDRAFHQKCLIPPLKTEDIPPGDEGWLCPGCDCKVDCIGILNEFQGNHLKVKDKWEKVFPEAEAIANGDKQYNEAGLPSDDSEDDDYNPAVAGGDTEDEEKSSSEDSDFTSTSEDLGDLKTDTHQDVLGLPSDDSEDDDFNPDMVDAADRTPQDEVSSDESDFTSDSDEFCDEICKSLAPGDDGGLQEALVSPTSRRLPNAQSNLGNDLSVSGKRQIERLDYKKLYDEEYGNESSDSSDDEDWSCMGKSGKEKKDTLGMEYASKVKNKGASGPSKSKVTSEKLLDSFRENQYPTRKTKVALAEELGLTLRQVEKWFENARRRNLRCSSKAAEQIAPTPVQSVSKNSSDVGQVAMNAQEATYTQSAFVMRCTTDDVSDVDAKSTQTQDTNQIIAGSGKKRKSLGQSEVSKRDGSGTMNCVDGIDEERKKAIARELRRRRLSR